jgi:uncharacterized surface protein with fasciclin (FAS1) repeats
MKINNHFSSLFLASMLGLTILSTSSCKKDKDDPIIVTNTITDIVVANASYSVLKEAVVKADLATTLKGTGPFTVFAPDNAAFSAAGITSATITAKTKAELAELLLYHTLSSKILAAGVPAGPNAKVITTGGDSIFVTNKAAGVFINGIQVLQADIPADNGVIHRLAKALNKPSGNIVATAQASVGALDSLVKAVLRVNNTAGGNPNIVSLLSNNTLTVFAPTNAAFTQLLGALGLTDINQIPIATLSAVLAYHVVPGRAFSSDLAAGPLTMFAGGNTTINLTGSATIKGNGNGANASTITATNIMCRNGVVHLIDRVLLP